MKKILAMTMALALLLGVMSISVGATYLDDQNHFTADDASNDDTAGTAVDTASDPIAEKDVTVKLTTSGTVALKHVYAVSYDVTEVSFTYNYGGTGIWNPETLAYEYDDTSAVGWGADTTREIKITNYSDLGVKITAEAGPVSANGVTLDVKETTGMTSNELTLNSAYNAGGVNKETTGSFTVTVGGAPNGDYTDIAIATITLTLSKVA